MTLRDSSVRNGTRKAERSFRERLRDKRRRKDRRLLSETLEQRQLLAGPDLVGIQPNEGALIRGGEVLTVSPRELVFRFDDQSDLDPLTVAEGISITRAGADRGFESATATTDLGTGGAALLEFRAAQSGARGNGIEVRLRASDRGTGSQVVNVTVNQADRIVVLDLNSNPGRPSVVRDVVSAVQNSAAASALIEVDQISGPSLLPVGPTVGAGIDVVLAGANAAQFITDLGTGGQARARFISTTSGSTGVGTTISVSRSNLNLLPGQLPFVTVSANSIQVILDSTPGKESTVNDLITAINSDSDASNLVFAQLELGNGNTIVSNTGFSPLTLIGATDTVVEPGFVGLGDTPHEVVFRFAETLPEDTYQVEIFGSGPLALRNIDGEAFADGTDFGVQFSVNNAPQVAAVVPTPVRRQGDGSLSPELNVIDVHFNENVANATDPTLYELIYTRDTVNNRDDVAIHPSSVTYSAVTRIARLEFDSALSRQRDPLDQTQFLGGTARLRIGSDRPIPDAPAEVQVNTDPADTFTGAFQLDTALLNSTPGAIESLTIDAEIENATEYGLQFPGGTEFPGVRNIRPDDPSRRDRTIPLDVWRRDGDIEPGISTVFYDFKPTWRGDDPDRGVPTEPDLDQLYFNLITDQQKQRVREVLSLYSEYLGVQFVEINAGINGIPSDGTGNPLGRYIAIAVGELAGSGSTEASRVGGVTVATRPLDETGSTVVDPDFVETGNELLVMDFQDFDASVDDQIGGEFFRGAFLGIGQLLGYGYADHLPQPVTQSNQFVLNPGDDNEPLFPSPSDIVNGQYLFRPESNDVDLYRFTLQRRGTVSIQTIAERLSNASTLDTTLRLYERTGVDDNGRELWQEIAANDDYFSDDSLIELELSANDYVVGVSASGNGAYDPTISGTGIGGLTEGDYELRITFESEGASVVVDQTQLPLDGDLDGRPGGEFDFWFIPADPINTLYVDKAFTGTRIGPVGVASNPFAEIDSALASAAARVTEDPLTGELVKQTVRIVGGGEYQIGLDNRALALPDGATLDVPKGVQLVIDAGSTFLMRRSRIGIGSTTDAPAADRSQSSIQVLGTPSADVVFRSFNSVPDFAQDNLAGTTVPNGFRFTAIDPTTNGQMRLFRVDSASFTFGASFVFPAFGLTRVGSDPANGGDWGGIDIRGDIDTADASRVNPEEFGVFLNHIQYADIRHGGGAVSVDGRQVVVSPVELAVTRATIINSRIAESADAAIAITPDTLAQTRFDEERFQRAASFTPDVGRAGPHIRGNEIVDNTINGLFIRVETRAGENLSKLNMNARVDDTDIVHVLSENLLIEGVPGGPNSGTNPPTTNLVRSGFTTAVGSVPLGSYVYKLTFVNRDGYETTPSAETGVVFSPGINGAIQLIGLPAVPVGSGFTGRRLYRATVDLNGNRGPFLQVASLNTDATTHIDRAAVGTIPIVPDDVRLGRVDPGLTIDPGIVLKFSGSRIDVTFDGHFYAEGTESQPIVLTSLSDNRFGAGGSFDTSSTDGQGAALAPGDWGGIYLAFGGYASIDHATIAGAGGSTRIEGGFASFNPIEVHQGDLRIANSRFEENGDGRNFINDPTDLRADRVGRGNNASGTIFIRGSQPVIVDNEFVNGSGPVVSFDVNSFTAAEQVDLGRSTGLIDAVMINGNSGPLIHGNAIGTTRLNRLDPNDPDNRNFACNDALGQNPLFDQNGDLVVCSLNGIEIRGGTVATEVVLDDVDVVHIVRDTIEIPNQHLFGGMRLQSDARGSLVVKFQTQDTNNLDTLQRRQAGIIAGGTLVTAEEEFIDIDDRIGGSLQIVGHPDFPVVLTALIDDTVGAGFTPDGRPNVDTDNNGLRLDEDGNPILVLTSETNAGPAPPPLLPLGTQYDRTDREEVDNANLIDNDIDPQVVGFLEAEIEYGSQVEDDVRFTYQNDNPANGPIGPLQLANVTFLYTTYIDVDVFFPFTNPAPLRLADTAANPPNPVLIGDDLVRSTGTFVLDAGSIDPNDALNTAPNTPRRIVDWTAESFIVNSRGTIYTRLDFETRDGGDFTDNIVSSVQVISYLDQGIAADDEDILYSVGSPGQPDFRALTINRDAGDRTLGPLIGFSHGGIYDNDNFNQINANYLGWAADDAPQLLNAIEMEIPTATYSVTGEIAAALTPSGDPLFDTVTAGTVARGEADIGTAFAWELGDEDNEARVTTFVEFFPSDPVDPFRPTLPPAIDGAGTWDGITIREAASDANITITSESEPSNLGNILVNDTNPIPSQSQFLGELAPDLFSGDNNRRLGFIVDGTIAQTSDLDVYAFIGEAGTQVWLDIDRTHLRLDTVVELIDANGNVRVLSDNSLTEASGDTDRLVGPGGFNANAARALGTSLIPDGSPDEAYQDAYSTNPRDAGMRIVLPGNVGQRFLYHVRVRSSNSTVPGAATLTDASRVRDGLTTGAYQLQVRLDETDIFPGSQVRYGDIRFAVNGVQIIGGPNHSPILADEYEKQSPNDTIAGAQRLGLYETLYDAPTVVGGSILDETGTPIPGLTLGLRDSLVYDRVSGVNNGVDVTLQNPAGPLTSDRLAKSVAGILDGTSDVDWYQFDVGYERLSRDAAALYLSAVFDLDYADGSAGADAAMYVFNAARELVMIGTDSNVADDQPPGDLDIADLSRGSLGTGDPFIGSAELSEGTYYVAISNQVRVPVPLSQFFDVDTSNPLLRLEPVDSVRRIVEDRIYRGTAQGSIDDSGNYNIFGNLIDPDAGALIGQDGVLLDRFTGEPIIVDGEPVFAGGGTASPPLQPVLFGSDAILEYSFDDVLLYVNTGNSLHVVNPFTGERYLPGSSLGGFGNEFIRDVAFRANGELFGFTGNSPANDAATEYVRIDTADASLTTIGNTGIQTFHLVNTDANNLILDFASNEGVQVEAVAIREFFGTEDGFFVGNRPVDRRSFLPDGTPGPGGGLQYYQNILYDFDDATGVATGPTYDRSRFAPGAGTTPREIGQIDTEPPPGPFQTNQLGITDATEINPAGVFAASLFDGDTFTLSNVTESVTFEFDQGFTLLANGFEPVRDGDSVVVDGVTFEFNTGARLALSDVAPFGLLSEGATVDVVGSDGTQRFEFVRFGQAQFGNIPIPLVDFAGNPLPASLVAIDLAAEINAADIGVLAQPQSGEVFFAVAPLSLSASGAGVQVVGDDGLDNAAAVGIDVSGTISPENLISLLADAIRTEGIPVSSAGTQLALPSSTTVALLPDPTASPSAFTLSGAPGVAAGNEPILLLPTDSADVIAERIAIAVQMANDAGDLPNVLAVPNGSGRSLNIISGFVAAATGNLAAGGVATGGLVTGIEVVNDQLYAVTDTGGLFRVSSFELATNGNRTIGSYVNTATDLIGINFSGLRAGPVSVENGVLSQILFGITFSGDIYAFNTLGELQPIFAGGRSVISTGVFGAQGLDFSVVDFNLWHVTGQRGGDPGHGIDPLFNNARLGSGGGSSLAFTYENFIFGSNYPSAVEQPTFAPRLDGTTFEDSYNVPGGAKGVVQSNAFSLRDYAAEDLPMLYFNYYAQTEGNPGSDALRVYVVTNDGVEHLVSTNGGGGEFQDPDPFLNPSYGIEDPTAPGGIRRDEIFAEVQRIFDTTNSVNDTWRQVRVPLSEFAGRDGLSLRVEFATGGTTLTTSDSLRVISGRALAEADDLEFVINNSAAGVGGETFAVQLAPTISFPSGLELANLYASDPTEAAVITIDGQEYLLNVLNDPQIPPRMVGPDQIELDLLAGAPLGVSLGELSADDIAVTVANLIQANLPANPQVTDFDFSDATDSGGSSRNDLLFEAKPLPYSGGNATITGFGQLGTRNDPLPPTNLDDVDLVRLEVAAGALIEVDVDLDFNAALDAAIRFFDAGGNQLAGILNPANDTVQFTALDDSVIYIGISGLGNETYDPRIPGSTQTGQIDSYTARVSITFPSAFRADGNLVEFVGGQASISATPTDLLRVTPRVINDNAINIPISRFMSASEIAEEVQRAIATRYTQGNGQAIPLRGPLIRLPGYFIDDPGPFNDESDRFASGGAGFRQSPVDNAFEGVYLDDFIIGFAERGEMATNANPLPLVDPVDPNDPNDPNAQFIAGPNPGQATTTGAYQFEIRDGSEYVISGRVLVDEPDLQFFSGQPIVVPISGVPFGVPLTSAVPVASVLPVNQNPFPDFALPTIDIEVDADGNPLFTRINENFFVTLVSDGTLVQLVELNADFTPVPSTFVPIPAEARFRTFDTNDRLASGFTVQTLSGTSLVDGATFTIFDSLNELNFEFDITQLANGLNDPTAVAIEVDADWSAQEVASEVVRILNSPNVQAVLDMDITRANTTTPLTPGELALPPGLRPRDFLDDRINLYGNISFVEVTPGFASVESFDQRGDSNRDRSEQGVIIIENSRFLFNSDSGVAINRDAEARVLSLDQRDEFPVALTYPANLIELNTEGLIPGVLVQNNVMAFNANNGVLISGLDGGGGALNNPVGFDQIINNTVIGGVVEPGVELGAQIFTGFLFEGGGISFADEVDRASLRLGSDVDAAFTDTVAALSSPDCFGHGPEPPDGQFTLSLGTGGQAVFRFTDNFLTGNDSPTPDLVIFEAGASETVRVEISRDGENYFFVGNASGLNNTIDIDQFGFDSSDRFAFVRLTDLVSPLDEPTVAFGAAGADIDAIGALSTVPATQFTPGAQGIVVTQNSGPTLLNNIVANLQTGIAVTPPSNDPALNDIDVSRDRTVIGGSTYFRNAFDALGSDEQALGLFGQIISDFEEIFVNATSLVFTPQHDVRTIDSSIDSLEERASLLTLRTAVGLPPVPILAPSVDLNGQLRVDDPSVDTPPGAGLSVFKDRGAEDRADLVGPRLSLINPRADDLLNDSGRAFTVGTIFDSFDIQLIDGITPADPSSGVGVDDGSVSGALIRVKRLEAGTQNTETLVEGVDYRFAYEPADNIIRLTPIAGIWQDNSVYTVEFLGDDVGILQGQDGVVYGDGALTQVDITVDDRRAIEIDTGIGISIAPSALTIDQAGAQVPNIEGQTLEVFDGRSEDPVIFELTTDNNNIDMIIASGNVPVRVGEAANAEQIASAVASAINASTLQLFATAVGNRIQLRDSVVKATELFLVQGAAAYLGADVTLSPELRGVNIESGQQSLTVFDGTNSVTFTLATNVGQVTSGTPVIVSPTARSAEIASAIKSRIDASGLQVTATVDGSILKLRGLSDRVDAQTALASVTPGSITGNPLNDAFKLTNFQLDVQLTNALITGVDGSTITIFDGEIERTFEFDNVPPVMGLPAVVPGNLTVPVGQNPTTRELLTALRERIERTELKVEIVDAARSFRITGTANPISVTSATGAVTVSGFGEIGTSPGFGIGIPSDGLELSDTVEDGQFFVLSRGITSETFELDFDGIREIDDSTLVPVLDRTIDAVANAIVQAINNSQFAITAQNIGGGRVTFGGVGSENVNLDVRGTVLTQLGIAGLPTPTPIVIPLDAEPETTAAAYSEAFNDLNVQQELIGERVVVRGLEAVRGTAVISERISDEVGNPAFLGELVIFVGGGFDYGDAPAPYASTAAQGGPRHNVDGRFALWRPDPSNPDDRPLTPDADAVLPNADEDNGVRLIGAVQPGFSANFEIAVHNEDARPFFVDAWFDWNGNGVFEIDEVERFGSTAPPGTPNRSILGVGVNVIAVGVPSFAANGEIYARFRLSEDPLLGPTGDASSGEVEDLRLVISNNPFQNPIDSRDVNNSGFVTPLDALQIINALDRNRPNGNINLALQPLPPNLPVFPDVDGDGEVSAFDALLVINELEDLVNGASELIGEGEAIGYVPAANGVLASGTTALGDALLNAEDDELAAAAPVDPPQAKTSVFDSAPVVALDADIESLAEDAAATRGDDERDALDQLFASL